MAQNEFDKVKDKIEKLSKKAYEADKALSLYVQNVIASHSLKNDPIRFKEVIDLLPTGLFRSNMLELYAELKRTEERM